MSIFQKKQKHPKCIAFVDFEHWYIALERQYGVKPDLKGWKAELMAKYEVDEIAVFGDFSGYGKTVTHGNKAILRQSGVCPIAVVCIVCAGNGVCIRYAADIIKKKKVF